MSHRSAIPFCLALLAAVFAPLPAYSRQSASVRVEMLALVDQARHRAVPVAFYSAEPAGTRVRKLAIISHGNGGKNTDYSFIARHLVASGYDVASIQHELLDDEALPSTGTPYVARMPSWQRGVQNILFVIDEMKRTRPGLDVTQLLLVGHSHGGDTSMLFARDHPALARAVISLDNRRMPIPRLREPRLFSIRSSDQPADPGVLPSPGERTAFEITVVTLPATIHNDMWDGATEAQKAEMIHHIDDFVRQLGG